MLCGAPWMVVIVRFTPPALIERCWHAANRRHRQQRGCCFVGRRLALRRVAAVLVNRLHADASPVLSEWSFIMMRRLAVALGRSSCVCAFLFLAMATSSSAQTISADTVTSFDWRNVSGVNWNYP